MKHQHCLQDQFQIHYKNVTNPVALKILKFPVKRGPILTDCAKEEENRNKTKAKQE